MTAVTLRPGQKLRGERGGVFLVVDWAGEGSYARIYRGEGAGGLFAIKLAKWEVAGAAERLLYEREAHAKCLHAAIPACLGAGSIEPAPGAAGTPWMARQWVEGVTLRQRLERDRSLPLVRTVPILIRLSDAVASLHAKGWSHGDLRSENILLEAGTQQAFLLDLGEARPDELCCHGRTGGSSPLERRSRDVRQLGELLARCLTGVDPAVDPQRLSRAAGFHPLAIQLWQEIRDARMVSAASVRDQLRRIAGQLGLRL